MHSRFSTNTFPSWPLAHPFRFVAHNGEINTVRGNRNRMHAREAMLASAHIRGDLSRLSPICTPDASDSASFDQTLELLHLGGRSLPHAVMMMIPEAWENNTTISPARRAFCQFHASIMEPWDGPACVTFTDGTVVGAVLDRNGLRPGRWWRTIDDRIILASESGRARRPVGAKSSPRVGSSRAGCSSSTPPPGGIVSDDEIKDELAAAEHPTASGCTPDCWISRPCRTGCAFSPTTNRWCAGRSPSDTPKKICGSCSPRWRRRAPSHWDRWAPTRPLAVLSQRSRLFYDYFVELFAQVTNPPLDAIREEIVTSMARVMGPEQNLLEPTAASCRQILLPWPVLDNDELNKIVHINDDGEHPGLRTAVLRALYDVERGGDGLADAMEDLRIRACEAIAQGRSHAGDLGPRLRSHQGADPVAAGGRRPYTTTWCAPRSAPRSRWWSKAVTPARCTTSRC